MNDNIRMKAGLKFVSIWGFQEIGKISASDLFCSHFYFIFVSLRKSRPSDRHSVADPFVTWGGLS